MKQYQRKTAAHRFVIELDVVAAELHDYLRDR